MNRNTVDRLFCWLLGHTWQVAEGRRVWRCPHCERRTTDVECIIHHSHAFPRRRQWRWTH